MEESIAAYRKAIALKPDYAEAYCDLGAVLGSKGHLEEAIAAYRQATALKPDFPEAYDNLGNALIKIGHLDEAISVFQRAVALKPDYAEAHCNLGVGLREVGLLDQAIVAFRQAIALKSDLAEAHRNLALALLAQGEWLEGWEANEWRWKCKDFTSPNRNFAQPQWSGQPLKGRTLLLHAEQGFGDVIQLVRYLPLVARHGGNIILECHPELKRLLQPNVAGCRVVEKGQLLPDFDLYLPLMSLPRIFRTTLENIPGNVPYLHADAHTAQFWKSRIAGYPPTLNVGLAWAGRPSHLNDRNRSIALASLGPLAQVPGIRVVSLQKGEAAAYARKVPTGMELIDWSEELNDFADTAALIANLDLVIAVDTAVVHLAGAMGKPVWVLLPYVPDWRWLLERKDSPWYPTMRLFRQKSLGDWADVIERTCANTR